MRGTHVVLGLGFGDEGKGSLVDWLARQAAQPPLVVRWNGGPQAAHHVVTDDGRMHCFAQLGSASFVPGARTHLGPEMVVDPYALHIEAAALAGAGVPDALKALTIDPRAVVVTPWHAVVNRVREALRGAARHGSTGRGVAEAKLGAGPLRAAELEQGLGRRALELRAALVRAAEGLVAAHADPPDEARRLLARAADSDLLELFCNAAHELRPAGVRLRATAPRTDCVLLEGAQGALLDREHGFFPHVTPSRITRAEAERTMRAMGILGPCEVWGVLRAFHTRHGEGPFPSEDAALAALLPEPHNRDDGLAGGFRIGWFDGVLARYAIDVAGPIDHLAITCLDRVEPLGRRVVVDAWATPGGSVTQLTAVPREERTELARRAAPTWRELPAEVSWARAIEQTVGQGVEVESWGPSARSKRRGG